MVPPFDTQFPPVLLTKMLLVTVAEPRIAPPPRPPALLPAKEQLVTVAVPPNRLSMAPLEPLGALLPEKVLLVTVTMPKPLAMAPPPPPTPEALLPEKVLLVTLSVPKLAMAPPPKADPLAMVR